MKIGTLTFHFAHNYGAMLQAYALPTKLKQLGYDAEVIDYRLPFIYDGFEKFSFGDFIESYKRKGNDSFIAFLKAVKNWHHNQNKDAKWYRFEDFLNNYLPKSVRISDKSSILNLGYNAIICGSDQIWNSHLTGGLIPLYFGDGLTDGRKIISYAASNGESFVSKEMWNDFYKLISNFDSISVREKGLNDYLNNHGITSHLVLDPVFLLTKEEWIKISVNPLEGDYVFTYSFNEPPHFFETADKVAKMLGKKLVCFRFEQSDKVPVDAIQITTGGPRELLGYIHHASIVISNSFHGIALSIIMEKQLINVPPLTTRERTDSIMSEVGLKDRIIEDGCDFTFSSNIDYEQVSKKVKSLRNESLDFLINSLK